MEKLHLIGAGLAALLMLSFGCTRELIAPSPDEDVHVSLALSVGQVQQSGTKMSDEITQHNMTPESFRGIDQVYILPFRTQRGNTDSPVNSNDALWDYRVALPQVGVDASFGNLSTSPGLIYNNSAHFYNHVYLRPETDAVLVYGKAIDASVGTASSESVVYLQHNGSLVVPDLDQVENAEDILFAPDPISSNATTSPKYAAVPWRDDLIQYYLNKIIQANVSAKGGTPKYFFNNPASYNNHPDLKAALEDFTNKGIYFPLSAEVVGDKLTKLYQALYPYATDANLSADYYYVPKNGAAFPYVYELAKAIVKLIYDDTKTSDQNTYATRATSGGKYVIRLRINGPSIYGLPYGIFPIQWQEGAGTFKVLYNIDKENHFNGLSYIPSDEICYPPNLWYYANSPLISTEEEDMEEKYTSAFTWDAICSNYTASGVFSHSRAAVVRDPVEYGVALMKLSIQKRTSDIIDFAGNNVDINNTKFPLTGIIIADQYPLAFDFTPLPSSDARAKMYYIYDADVNNDSGNPRAWITRSNNVTNADLTTIILPTRSGADVHFALEFQNKTNYTTYTGAEGCQIPPGQHFYLAGILKFSERTDNSGQNLGNVFVHDHVTEVKASITSLKAAYDILPDLTDPQLQLGVQAEFGWDLSTPTTVPVVIQ